MEKLDAVKAGLKNLGVEITLGTPIAREPRLDL